MDMDDACVRCRDRIRCMLTVLVEADAEAEEGFDDSPRIRQVSSIFVDIE